MLLSYDYAAVGPGEYGPYRERDLGTYDSEPAVRAIYKGLARGDTVVLKKPNSKGWGIIAIGEVDSEIGEFIPVFEDVEGFDIRHARKTIWRRLPSEAQCPGLVQGRLARVNDEAALATIEALKSKLLDRRRPLPLPEVPPELTGDDISSMLVSRGIRVSSADEVSASISRIRRLAKWYKLKGADMTEHEVRTFLVIPFLLSLGWSEQRIKIEWGIGGGRRIDIALFAGPYPQSKEIVSAIETKNLGDALLRGVDQVAGYAATVSSAKCLFVTDGVRYKLVEQSTAGQWSVTGYMNLRTMWLFYPFSAKVSSASHVLTTLLPKGP